MFTQRSIRSGCLRTGLVIVVAAAGLLTMMLAPAGAAGSGTATSVVGIEVHPGVPTFPVPAGNPCSIFSTYQYTGVFQGAIVVGGTTYSTEHAVVSSTPGDTWAEGPAGTYWGDSGTGPDSCDPNTAPSAVQHMNLVLTLEGTGLPLTCTGTGTYLRTDTTVTYTFSSTSCGSAFTFNLTIVEGPQPDLPPFDWTTLCTGPIAPAGCVNQGTLVAS